MKCQKCGETLRDGARFCDKCGTKVCESIKSKLPAKKAVSQSKTEITNKRGRNISIGILIAIIMPMIIFALAWMTSALTNKFEQRKSITESRITTETFAEEKIENVFQEYKDALKKAEVYNEYLNMSKKGLYNQLTSEYGEGFSAESAQYAVDNINADWNNNALERAKYYYNMNMSKESVYEQLVSEYGEQFTENEAQYAIEHLED